MKQSNWYLIFNYLFFFSLIFGSNNCFGLFNSSQNLHFGSQKPNSQILQAANRPDSHARIYANHKGGFWKMMDIKNRRLGTYDETLTKK